MRHLRHRAEDHHGAFSMGTADDFVRRLAAARPYLRSMQHHITTANFAISGSTAEGEIYSIATHTIDAGDRDVDVLVGGRYLDKYEKRSDTWKFVERKIVTDWARVDDPSAVDLTHPITKDTPPGAPDANDPSYQFFSLLTGSGQKPWRRERLVARATQIGVADRCVDAAGFGYPH